MRWLIVALAAVVLLVVDMGLRYLEYETLVSKAERVEGDPAWTVYFDGREQFFQCGVFKDFTEDEKSDSLRALLATTKEAAVALRRNRVVIGDLMIPPWHRRSQIARNRIEAHWLAWESRLDRELAALEPIAIAFDPDTVVRDWWDAAFGADPAIEGTWLAAEDAFDEAMPFLGLFNLRSREEFLFNGERPWHSEINCEE